MSYFIDREKVVAQIEGTYCEECETKGNPVKCQPCFVYDFTHSWLGRREDVVRCKDCTEWQDDWGDGEDGCHFCAMNDRWTKADFYCADGVRKEKENDKRRTD